MMSGFFPAHLKLAPGRAVGLYQSFAPEAPKFFLEISLSSAQISRKLRRFSLEIEALTQNYPQISLICIPSCCKRVKLPPNFAKVSPTFLFRVETPPNFEKVSAKSTSAQISKRISRNSGIGQSSSMHACQCRMWSQSLRVREKNTAAKIFS